MVIPLVHEGFHAQNFLIFLQRETPEKRTEREREKTAEIRKRIRESKTNLGNNKI